MMMMMMMKMIMMMMMMMMMTMTSLSSFSCFGFCSISGLKSLPLFSNSSCLKKLDAEDCDIQSLPDNLFQYQLEEINLKGNKGKDDDNENDVDVMMMMMMMMMIVVMMIISLCLFPMLSVIYFRIATFASFS